MSALQLQVLYYHPSAKLVASMGWVEGPFSTSISSDLKFLEASENATTQPTTNHLTSDTTVLQTVPTHVRAHNARGFCSRHGTYLPKSTSSGFFVHVKSQIPLNLLRQENRQGPRLFPLFLFFLSLKLISTSSVTRIKTSSNLSAKKNLCMIIIQVPK